MDFHNTAMLITLNLSFPPLRHSVQISAEVTAHQLKFHPSKTENLIAIQLPGQVSDLIICHCKQHWGNHGQPTVPLTSLC